MKPFPDNKNILIIGSPRSGTHALGSHLAERFGLETLSEICVTDEVTDPVEDIKRMFDLSTKKVAHLVQLTGKLRISHLVNDIKQHCWIIALRRRDKVQQFASWMYFHQSGGVLRQWHNHQSDHMVMTQNSVNVTQEEVDQFLLEQMLDDFFQPDDTVYYEDLDFNDSKVKKNLYAWDLPLIFSNLDFVKKNLDHWRYDE